MNDVTPPRLRIVSTRHDRITVSVTDSGAGVDPESLTATLDGHSVIERFRRGRLTFATSPGRHLVIITASDYQELKNMEDVAPIKPNTSTLRRTVVVHG